MPQLQSFKKLLDSYNIDLLNNARKVSGFKFHRQFVDQHEKNSAEKATIKWRRVGKNDKVSLSKKNVQGVLLNLIESMQEE